MLNPQMPKHTQNVSDSENQRKKVREQQQQMLTNIMRTWHGIETHMYIHIREKICSISTTLQLNKEYCI